MPLFLAILLSVSAWGGSSSRFPSDWAKKSLAPNLSVDPQLSQALTKALKEWAERKERGFPTHQYFNWALWKEGFYYPVQTFYQVLATTMGKAKEELKTHRPPPLATDYGVGVFRRKEGDWHVVIGFFQKRVDLKRPISSFQNLNAQLQVEGSIPPPYRKRTSYFLGLPSGEVRVLQAEGSEDHFILKLPPFKERGGYQLEIVVEDAVRGPQVALLAPFWVDAAPSSPPQEKVPMQTVEKAEAYLFKAVNLAREEHGSAPLLLDPLLRKVARAHSLDMLSRNYFAHRTPEGDGPEERVFQAGREGSVGENIALDESIPSAHRALMFSPGHRRNILDPKFTRIGVGVAFDGVRYAVTELFLLPRETLDLGSTERELKNFVEALVQKRYGYFPSEENLLSEVAAESAEASATSERLSFFVHGTHLYDLYKIRGGSFEAMTCSLYSAQSKQQLKTSLEELRLLQRFSFFGLGLAGAKCHGDCPWLYATLCFSTKE